MTGQRNLAEQGVFGVNGRDPGDALRRDPWEYLRLRYVKATGCRPVLPGSLLENPIWLRAACFPTGLRPAASTIYTDIACFAVLASRKTARSRADDGILRHTPRESMA